MSGTKVDLDTLRAAIKEYESIYLYLEKAHTTGDALVTSHPALREHRPRRVPDFFSHAPEQARESLSGLADLDADTIAPGHGQPWRGSLADAVRQAQQ